uniref:RNA helicase n=1 Tax=Alexandrium monilatum TaxID=311494 RepID=A0A7S4VMD0_9DINO
MFHDCGRCLRAQCAHAGCETGLAFVAARRYQAVELPLLQAQLSSRSSPGRQVQQTPSQLAQHVSGVGAAILAARLAHRRRRGDKALRRDAPTTSPDIAADELKRALREMEREVPALKRFLSEDVALGVDFASMSPKCDDGQPIPVNSPVSILNDWKHIGIIRQMAFTMRKMPDGRCLILCTCNVDAGVSCGLGLSTAPKRAKQCAASQIIDRLRTVKDASKEFAVAGKEYAGAQMAAETLEALGEKHLRNIMMTVLQPCGTTYKVFIQAEFQGRRLFGLSRLYGTLEEAVSFAGEMFYFQLRATLRIPKDELHEPEAWAEVLNYEATRQTLELGKLGKDDVQAQLAECVLSGEDGEKLNAALEAAVKRQEARLVSIAEEGMSQEGEAHTGVVARRCWEVTKPEDEEWRRDEIKGKLPAEKIRADISKALEYNKVVVVSGGTGSGKSTQLPQFLLDDFREWKLEWPEGEPQGGPDLTVDGLVEVEYEDVWYTCTIREVAEDKSTITVKYHDGGDVEGDVEVESRVRRARPFWAQEVPRIVVTQPRRIAAVTLAQRVAWERFGEVGGEIGHAIRGDTIFPASETGTVEFCTVGTLLRRLISDPLLTSYNVVVLDEVHERDLFTDFLLVLLKELLVKRPDLRLVLMSATLDVQTFVNYMPGCQVVEVPTGTRYPVEEVHLDDPFFDGFPLSRTLLSQEAEARENSGATMGGSGAHEFALSAADTDSESERDDLVERVQMIIEADDEGAAKWEKYCVDVLGGSQDPAAHAADALRSFLSQVDDEEDKQPPSAVLSEQIQQVASFSDQVREAWIEYCNNREGNEPAQEWESSELLAFLEAQGIRPWKVELASWEVTSSLPWWGGDTNDKTFLELTGDLIEKVAPDMLEVTTDDEFGVGSILCFLPGWGEIKSLAERLEASAAAESLWVLRLHSMVGKDEQRQVFETAPPGRVKVILATNIAESSVTINDVRVVIDSGLHREVTYDPKGRMSSMETVWICQSNAVQRKGRAGRVRAGRVFRLYSREQFESVPWRPAPEIQRCNLSQTCLQTIALGRDPREFLARAPDPPRVANLESAMAELAGMGAIQDGVPPTMLPVGQVLSRLPLEPLLGRAMVLGTLFGIPQTTAALLTVSAGQSPFLNDPERRREIKEKRLEYCSWSDTIGSLRALVEFEQVYKLRGEYDARQWADHYCLSFQRLMGFSRIRFQLLQDVQRSGILDAAATDGMNPDEWVQEEEEDDGEGSAFWEDSSAGAIFQASEMTSGLKTREWLEELQSSHPEVQDERLLIGILVFAFPTNLAVRKLRHQKLHMTSTGSKAIIDQRSVNSQIDQGSGDMLNQNLSWLPEQSWWLYGDLRMYYGQKCLTETTYASNWNLALFGGLREQEKDSLELNGRIGLELNGWIGIRGASEEINTLLRRLRQEIRQSLTWVSIASSWDRVAIAAVGRSKTLLRILGRALVGERPDEADLRRMREWRLPEFEEGSATLQADEETRDEVESRLRSKTVAELRVLLREMGAKVSGRKMELVQRCTDYLMYGEEQPDDVFEGFEE